MVVANTASVSDIVDLRSQLAPFKFLLASLDSNPSGTYHLIVHLTISYTFFNVLLYFFKLRIITNKVIASYQILLPHLTSNSTRSVWLNCGLCSRFITPNYSILLQILCSSITHEKRLLR